MNVPAGPSAASSALERLEKLLGTPRDGALLRFSIGLEYAKSKDLPKAIEHLRRAVDLDPGYSAAWRALGKALEAAGQGEAALAAYRDGIAAAQKKGDKQAEKEMTVFARRIEKGRAA
jgi:tetratricopeptide (TPR) repeat protein